MKPLTLLRVAGINIAAVSIGLLVFEKIAKEANFINLPTTLNRSIRLREHMPYMDKYIRPDANYMRTVDSLEQKNYRLRTDSNGFIIPSGSASKASTTILFLGGSTTECMYVDEDKRFPYLVATKLSNPLQEVRTLNGGVSGNTSVHSMNTLLNKGLASKPNIVVMMHNINDLAILLRTRGNYWLSSNWMDDEGRSLIYTVKPTVEVFVRHNFPITVHGLRVLKSYFSQLKDRVLPVSSTKHVVFSAPENQFKNPLTLKERALIHSEFRKSLIRFVYVVQASGSTPVLMTQMNRVTEDPPQFLKSQINESLREYGLNYAEFRNIYSDFNRIIRAVAREHNIPLIDLAKDVPQTKDYMYDFMHLNNKGSALVADIVANNLRLLLIASTHND